MTSRTVKRAVRLEAAAQDVWEAVRRPSTLVHVAGPLVRFPDLQGRESPWSQGETVFTRVRLLGVVPFSRHRLRFERLDDELYELQTEEGGGPVRSWRHLIRVTPAGPTSCVYLDEVVIDAGALRRAVVAWAELFYAHRQRRWQDLVARGLL